jgi:hypothetical protein
LLTIIVLLIVQTTDKFYTEARFWRPTGLGNRLFSWARACVYAKESGAEMLSPQWAHFRGGSITRGGIDYKNAVRKILLFDNFRSRPCEISGVSRLLIEKTTQRVTVKTLPDARMIVPENKMLVSFDGSNSHVFDDLWSHHAEITEDLCASVKKKWLPVTGMFKRPFLAINVRLGNDFKKIPEKSDFVGTGGYLQTPLTWYIKTLRELRKLIGTDMPAIIISDGTAAALKPLLDEPFTYLGSAPSAAGDLLILAKSKLLLGAGRSSFSAWASFLGKMPTISIPGSDLQSFHVSENLSEHYVGEWDGHSGNFQLESALKSIQFNEYK